MDKNKNQGQPGQEKKGGQPNQQENLNKGQSQGSEPKDNNPSGKTGEQPQGGQQPQGGEQAGEWKRPLTNQDEERQVTNAGKSDDNATGEEESEGDQRIKPYKNIGDDSEEVEKKTPTME